jgi:hypothetical protein
VVIICSLNNDDQKFQQYQETIEHKKTSTYSVGNSGTGLEHAQKCGVVKPINGILQNKTDKQQTNQ